MNLDMLLILGGIVILIYGFFQYKIIAMIKGINKDLDEDLSVTEARYLVSAWADYVKRVGIKNNYNYRLELSFDMKVYLICGRHKVLVDSTETSNDILVRYISLLEAIKKIASSYDNKSLTDMMLDLEFLDYHNLITVLKTN